MDLTSAGLKEQAFRSHGEPIVVVPYAAHRAALDELETARNYPLGVSLLQGPPLSGKSVLLREFIGRLPENVACALVDGSAFRTNGLLESVLHQFGYDVEDTSTSELHAILKVFSLQQAAQQHPPVVIVENAHLMRPGAMRAVADLAALQARQNCAIKLFLASDRSLQPIVAGPDYAGIDLRITRDIHLHPMRIDEVAGYLHAKLRAAGSSAPMGTFPLSVCNEIFNASDGWPGVIDRIALLALAKADTLPVPLSCVEHPAVAGGTWERPAKDDHNGAAEVPELYISRDGALLRKFPLHQSRLLVGRSEHNDLAIDSRFVSRHHLLLVRSGTTTLLMDLNSTNGTFVNSKRVSNHVLTDNDVITLGHFRVKFADPQGMKRVRLQDTDFAETVIMKSLDDMRALLAREHTEELPPSTENLPTLGGG